MIKILTSNILTAFTVAFFTVFFVFTQDIFSQASRGAKRATTKKDLLADLKSGMEFGLRAGYFHPLTLKHADVSKVLSERSPQFAYSVDLYYTLDLSYFTPGPTSDHILNSAYIPDFHTFLNFSQYFLKSNIESIAQNSLLMGLGIGFLYSFDLFTNQSLKAGLMGGLHYEISSFEGVQSGILLDIYVLLDYEYTFKGINYGIYQRTQFSPDKRASLLGIGAQLAVGYLL